MLNHIWTITCLRVITDTRTGLTSYIDTIESVGVAPGKPIVLPPFVIASKWCRSGKTNDTIHIEVNFSIKGPSSKRKKQVQLVKVDLPQDQKGMFLQLETKGLKLSEPGDWLIHVSWRSGKERWKEVATLPLHVDYKDDKGKK